MSKSQKRAFTLVELLTVISIISFLSTIALASLNSARNKAYTARINSTAYQYIIALQEYYIANGSYPVTPLNSYYCLGSGTCEFQGVVYAQNNTLNTALNPYIPGLPPIDDVPIRLSKADGNLNWQSQVAMPIPITLDYQGAVYKCINITSDGSCNDIVFSWAVPAAGSSNVCGKGKVTGTNNISSECTVELK